MASWSFIVPLALLALIAIIFFSQKSKEIFPYKAKNYLLTDAEFAFYEILLKSIDTDHAVAMKVRLADVIDCSEADWKRGFGPKISSKHVDFVLYERSSSRVLLCLELDDSSHTHPDRVARDAFFNKALAAAAVPLLRVKVARTYDGGDLRKDITRMISQT